MTIRRKNKRLDDVDDWDDEPTSAPGEVTAGDAFQVHLSDYVIEEKVAAFVNTYAPAPDGMDDTSEYVEVFDDARLRSYFKAYPCGLGDPLKLYVEDLKLAHFRMKVSVTGKPCIFAIRKG